MNMQQNSDKARESKLRREAKKQGYVLKKSRAREWSVNNQQGYMIVNERNVIEAGSDFDLTLDQVESFLSEQP